MEKSGIWSDTPELEWMITQYLVLEKRADVGNWHPLMLVTVLHLC